MTWHDPHWDGEFGRQSVRFQSNYSKTTATNITKPSNYSTHNNANHNGTCGCTDGQTAEWMRRQRQIWRGKAPNNGRRLNLISVSLVWTFRVPCCPIVLPNFRKISDNIFKNSKFSQSPKNIVCIIISLINTYLNMSSEYCFSWSSPFR